MTYTRNVAVDDESALLMKTPRPSAGFVVEVGLAAALLFVSLSWLAPRPQTNGDDLVQDYLSARALLAGEDPYQPLQPLRETMGLPTAERFRMKADYNPHPPVAVLLTIPVACLPFDEAYRVFRVIQIVLLAVAWVWACRSARVQRPIATVGGGLALGLWPPVWGGLDWGQPVGLMGLLAVALWHLASTQKPATASAMLALSALVRPLFGGMVAAAGGWSVRALAIAVVSAVGVTGVSFLLVGVTPWEWYDRAWRAGQFADAGGSIPAACELPISVGVAGFLFWTVAISGLARRGLPARDAAALGLTGGLLWYPLAWFHYDVVLIPVAVWAGCEAARRGNALTVLFVAGYVGLRFVPPYASIPGSMTWFPVAGRLCLLVACALLAATQGATRPPGPTAGPA